MIIRHCAPSTPHAIAEPALRAMISLCYTDHMALSTYVRGKGGEFVRTLILQTQSINVEVGKLLGCLASSSISSIRT